MKKKIKIGIFLVLILVLAQILTLEFQKSKDSEAVESTDYRLSLIHISEPTRP